MIAKPCIAGVKQQSSARSWKTTKMLLPSTSTAHPSRSVCPPAVPPGRPFRLEIYVDLLNVEYGLTGIGRERGDGELLREMLRELARAYGRRLGINGLLFRPGSNEPKPSAGSGPSYLLCQRVYCVTALPAHVNPLDRGRVEEERQFQACLRRDHGFEVVRYPLEFHGFRLRPEDRHRSANPDERAWQPREKFTDQDLGGELLVRCLSSDAPDGVVTVTGDADVFPALQKAAIERPHIHQAVAAFRHQMSSVYCEPAFRGHQWQSPPIFLDDCLAELDCGPALRTQGGGSLVHNHLSHTGARHAREETLCFIG